MLVPFQRMMQRVETARQDSDTALFFHLLYFGEMVAKTLVLMMVAGIQDDPDKNRYRQLHRLVRFEGIGEWASVLEEVLSGPASQHLAEDIRSEQRDLMQKVAPEAWQYEASSYLDACLRKLDKNREGLASRLDGRKWLALFAELRNKTRGHGATSTGQCSAIAPDLEKSILLVAQNFSGFQRQWAYLHRNLSGKYKVLPISPQAPLFDPLKSKEASREATLVDGIYIYFDRPYRVDLLQSDADLSDFLYPNGAFKEQRFELISYITDSTHAGDSSAFLLPTGDLPKSETQGLGVLEIQGQVFGNLPTIKAGYIHRNKLEQELSQQLTNDRHPVITLVGRGGIGKTSLALSVLHEISNADRFGAIVWFSSRDIDLLPEGPKIVRPHLLNQNDIAAEFVRLISPAEAAVKGFKKPKYFTDALTRSPIDQPFLFVFDNFETVSNPVEVFTWLDTFVRPPNKILITSRSREFRGDYPVEIMGMTEQETEDLISTTARELGIEQLVSDDYRKELFRESEGHPYVIKVLLGEVAKAGKVEKIRRLVASKDNILDALFDRTYLALTPSARLVFLTLCSWRTTVPALAVEAVMLRPANEKMDVDAALEELRRNSFIEMTLSIEDQELFVTVPLVASEFGRRKLAVSAMKAAVEANMQWLLYFGAGQKTDMRHGVGPRVERFFKNVATEVGKNPSTLNDYLPIMEFIAQRFSPAWLLLASLYEESGTAESAERAKDALQRFLEKDSTNMAIWSRLAFLCKRTMDWLGEIHARVEICSLPGTTMESISETINRWNGVYKQQIVSIAADERHLIGRKLLAIFNERLEEADATDFSRAAWLCLSLEEIEMAKEFTHVGLRLEPDNEFCQNLAAKLNMQMEMPGISNSSSLGK
jgi:hypothetical protein